MNEIITIKQLPEIEAHLQILSGEITERVNTALSLVVSEDTVKEVKKVRAELNKESAPFKDQLKTVEAQVLAPWYEFKSSAKSLVLDKYADADAQLKTRIDEVEDGLKKQKHDEVIRYFNELCLMTGVGFVTFDQLGLKVNLTASIKSLKEQVSNFISKVADDVLYINSRPENSIEILVEYKKCLSVTKATDTVEKRLAEIKEQEYAQAAVKARQEAQSEGIKKVEVALPPPIEVSPPQPVSSLGQETQISTMPLIVNVQFESKSDPGTYKGRAYSYFSKSPLVIGEIVTVPTAKGEGNAMVTAVDVAPDAVGCDLSLLKYVKVLEDTDPIVTLEFRVTASISKLKELKKFLIDGGYQYE